MADKTEAVFEKTDLPGVKNIIVVASGKGGVGKSTVAANLAVSLARQGNKTALVDADLYGPSIPIMFGIQNESPVWGSEHGKEVLYPIEKFGVKLISIGLFVTPGVSLIWRGPLAAKGLMQLFGNTVWGDTDYMIVDFPPGTGDIQLTAIQKLKITGAIVVTTPQEVAVADARKAASMFTDPELKVPILGIIENMSWFTPSEHTDEKYFIFGRGGGKRLAEEFNISLLGQIPLIREIGECSDQGKTVYDQPDISLINIFDGIAHLIKDKTQVKI